MSSIAVFTKMPNLFKELCRVLPSVKFLEVTSGKDEILKNVEVIVGDFDLCGPILYDLPKVKWYQGTWAGIDKLLSAINVQNPPPCLITRFSGQHFGRIMSEYVVASIVNHERNVAEVIQNQKNKVWTREGKIGDYRIISDLTFGILGVGSIGNRIGKILHSLGGKVIGFGRKERSNTDPETKYLNTYYHNKSKLSSFLQECDYIINVLPSTPDTQGLLNGNVLENCKNKPTVFINIGRGSIINETDLINSLNNKWLSGAILDVFNTEPLPEDSPLWKMSQVTITPHCSGMSRTRDIAEQFVEFYKLYQENKPIPTTVDFKNLY